MNLGDLRLAVRTQLDLDESDLPNTLLDLYLQDGFDRIVALENRWPFYESTWAVASDNEGLVSIPVDAIEVDAVVGDAGPLKPIDQRYADDFFVQSPVSGLRPLFYTRSTTMLQLWPKPTTAQVLRLRGYRRSGDWVASGAAGVVDADRRLHYPIVHYACSMAMAQQEDEVLEATYLNRFRESASIARESVMRPWSAEPRILNSSRYTRKREPTLILDLPDTIIDEFDGTIEGGTP